MATGAETLEIRSISVSRCLSSDFENALPGAQVSGVEEEDVKNALYGKLETEVI
jgi:hypothetical protein